MIINNMFNLLLKVTTEQEDYVRGFEDALNSLHNSETQNTRIVTLPPTTQTITTNSMSGGAITYTNLGKDQFKSYHSFSR